MLTAKYRPDDSITLTKGLPITVRRLSGDRLALSVTCGDTGALYLGKVTVCKNAVSIKPPRYGY